MKLIASAYATSPKAYSCAQQLSIPTRVAAAPAQILATCSMRLKGLTLTAAASAEKTLTSSAKEAKCSTSKPADVLASFCAHRTTTLIFRGAFAIHKTAPTHRSFGIYPTIRRSAKKTRPRKSSLYHAIGPTQQSRTPLNLLTTILRKV
jgi:hypothetical protein